MKQFIIKKPMKLFCSFIMAFLLSYYCFSQQPIMEDFSSAVDSTAPTGWSQQTITGDSTSDIWHFDNPGGQTITAPISGNAAIYDNEYNDCPTGPGSCSFAPKRAVLYSKIFNASILDSIFLSWDQTYTSGGGAGVTLTVEAYNGATWDLVYDTTAGNLINESKIFDISSKVSGVDSAQIRFDFNIAASAMPIYWIIDNVKIDAGCSGLLPTANFSADSTQFCDSLNVSVQFSNSSANAISWSWTSPGGTPANSTDQNPTVMYSSSGIYDVTLTSYGCGSDSSTLTQSGYITVDSCAISSINELVILGSLILSPNPTTGILNITFDVHEIKPTSIKIYNVLGEFVSDISHPNDLLMGNYSFDLSEQPNGTYFVQIKNGNGVITKKVNIIR